MATESLKIVVGADLSGATTALKDFIANLKNLGIISDSTFEGLTSAFNKFPPSASAAAKSLGSVSSAAGKADDAINDLNSAKPLGNIPPASKAAAAALSNIKPGANQAAQALTNVGRVAQDLPFGFIGIQNNLNPLLESFQRLKQETGSTGGALKALASSIVGSGGLGLAVSLISAAASFASIGFSAWSRSMGGSGSAAKKAKEEVDEFQKTIEEVGNAVGRDAAKVTTLFNALTSGSLDTKQRKKALDDLKNINVEFFGALKDEKGVVEGLSAAYDGYLNRLKDIGRAKAIESQLTKLFDKKLQLELQLDPKFIASTDESTQRVIGNLRKELEKLGGAVTFDAKGQATGEKEAANFFDKTNSKIEQRIKLQTQIQDLERGGKFIKDENFRATQKEISQLDLRIKGLGELQKAAGNFDITEKTSGGSKKEDTTLKLLKDQLQGLQKEQEVVNKLRDEGLLPIFRENDALQLQLDILKKLNEIDAREVAIKAKPKLEIDPELNEFEITKAFQEASLRLFSKVKLPKISKATAAKVTIGLDVDPIFDQVKISQEFSEFGKKLTATIGPQNAINVPVSVGLSPDFDKSLAATIEKMKKAAAAIKEENAKIVIDLDQTAANLQESIIGAFDGLGAAIGEAFSGGGFGGVLAKFGETLLKVVGGVLQDIGKQIIVASKLVTVLKKILSSVGLGAASLVVGFALVALGGVLKNIKFSTPQFEKGGIASGPRSGYLATLHGTELIIPMNKIDKKPSTGGLRGSAINSPIILQPSLSIDGRSIKVMLNRIDRTDNRIF